MTLTLGEVAAIVRLDPNLKQAEKPTPSFDDVMKEAMRRRWAHNGSKSWQQATADLSK